MNLRLDLKYHPVISSQIVNLLILFLEVISNADSR